MTLSIPWCSLKLRLAITAALLMGASVAITVVHAVREAQGRAKQSVLESNLGVGQIAAGLSARVVEHEKALSAAAHDWPAGQAMSDAGAGAFLAHQTVLRAMFDRVLLLDDRALPGAVGHAPMVSPPVRDFGAADKLDVIVSVPVAAGGPRAWTLAGTLSLRSGNFLTDAGREETLGEARLQTIVADQQGRVLAHADPASLLTRIDDDPRLRQSVARWRSQGSPLEPAPWTEQDDGYFVAMAAVPGTDWVVFRVAPAEALFGHASRSILRVILFGAVSGLVGAMAIFGVTAWFLQPMSRLKQRALRALDPKQPAHEGWPESAGEIGELSRVLRHVSEQLAASRLEMAQALRRMQAVLDHAPTGIAFTIDGRFALASREFERILGYGRGELIGKSWKRLLSSTPNPLRESARAAFREDFGVEPEMELRCRDGSLRWVSLQGAVVQGRDSSQHKIWIVADATNARRERECLQWSADHDPLTDLVNRREFEHQLRKLVDDRRSRSSACALFIDLDHFKQVNDHAGHAAGDVMLTRVAQALRQCVRGEDVVARLGGDEFAVLLRGCALQQAVQIAEQIRAEVQAHGQLDGVPLGVTASIGVVEIDNSHATLSAVLEKADQACYAAKHAGRNAVRTIAGAPLPAPTQRVAA